MSHSSNPPVGANTSPASYSHPMKHHVNSMVFTDDLPTIFKFDEPIKTLQTMEEFLARPCQWKLRSSAMKTDAKGKLVPAYLEYADEHGDWIVRIDFADGYAELRPLRTYLVPEMQSAVVRTTKERLEKLDDLLTAKQNTAAEESFRSMAAFRRMTSGD